MQWVGTNILVTSLQDKQQVWYWRLPKSGKVRRKPQCNMDQLGISKGQSQHPKLFLVS